MPRGHETILLVEDEAAVRRSAARALRQLGYNVLEAANGRDALAVGRREIDSIALVITDIVMPWLGGKDLAEGLREMRSDVRVLFMSGYTDDAEIRAGIDAGEVDFIAKPFTSAQLAQKVRELLDREHPIREAAATLQ
jgi:DNA-binding response OmpR family regulator